MGGEGGCRGYMLGEVFKGDCLPWLASFNFRNMLTVTSFSRAVF